MGQQVSQLTGECGVGGLCAPQDPAVEERSTLTTEPPMVYGQYQSQENGGAVASNAASGGTTDQRFTAAEEPRDASFHMPAPAPSEPAHAPEPASFVPSPPSYAAPPAADVGGRSPGGAGGGGGGGGRSAGAAAAEGVDLEMVIQDLELCEEKVFGAVFQDIAQGAGVLQADDALMREFFLTHSAITQADVDTEILKIASTSDTLSIDREGFVALLRENALSENDALQQFMGLTSNGENIPSEDCRTGLLNLIQQIAAIFSGDKSERVFDSVMVDAGLTVSMEQWLAYSKRVARMVRLLKYAGV